MSARTRLILIGAVCVLGLISLAVFVPPDGQERSDLVRFLGDFHPLAVHLPIALLLLVPVLEIAGRNPRRAQLRASAGFVLGLAVLSAIATPYLGWMLAWSGGFEGRFVTQHMWGGISVAAAALLCWSLRGRRRDGSGYSLPAAYVGLLTITVLVVTFTGYRGGQLALGENHLTEHMPGQMKAWLGLPADSKHTGGVQAATFFAARIEPIFEQHCLLCHSENKHKGGLRLDSYDHLVRGGKDGVVIKAGDAHGSELFRRVSLDPDDKDVMPAEGKPPLAAEERKLLELWINAGSSPTIGVEAVAGAPAITKPLEPLAPDYRPDQQTIAQLEAALGVRLVPRSQNPRDGLILRTASFPAHCNDAALAKLAPIARYVVDAELSRTPVTDAGLKTLASFTNLRRLDLSGTAITSAGLGVLSALPKLELLNLTATRVNDAGVGPLRKQLSFTHIYVFQTNVTPSEQEKSGG
jgi:uncharacterized membrane protein